jgi:16S rRNA (guanine(966)-N(2))-methyltransferase RsmD
VIRISGGEFRGRSIETPKDLKTRPTQAKLRQALFNSIQLYVPGARILDLFSGSGCLGLEGLSRGAQEVVFVEQSREICSLIEKNAKSLGVFDRVRIINQSVDAALKKSELLGKFQIVLADPPYELGWELKLLGDENLAAVLIEGARFCLEWGRLKSGRIQLPETAGKLVKVREKNYGDSVLTTYQFKEKSDAKLHTQEEADGAEGSVPGNL